MKLTTKNKLLARARLALLATLTTATLAACDSNMRDLEQFVAETKQKHQGRVEPLPPIAEYETVTYSEEGLRDPFKPSQNNSGATVVQASANGPRPSKDRRREVLENFPLDSLKMVGILKQRQSSWALVQDKDGTIHRVQPGNYAGNGGTSRAQALGKLRLLAVAIGASTVMAQHSLASTLDHMSYTTLPGNQQQISFTLSDPVNDPQSFKIDHPARIAIDLMGTTNALDKRVVPVGVGNLESVSIVEANDRTRLVLNLGAMTGYETKIDGDRLLVTLDSGADTSAEGLSGPGEDVITQSFDDSELQLPANADAIPEIEVLVADAALLADASMPAPTSIDELPIAETLPMPDALEVPEIAAATDVEFEDDGLVVELPSSLPLDFKSDEEDSRVLAIDDFAVETGAPIEEYIDDRPVAQTQPIPRMEDKQSFASRIRQCHHGRPGY